MDDTKLILNKKLNREMLARQQAEQLLEQKSHELYELNETLLKTNSILEETVKERTQQIEEALKKAVAGNHAKSQFLANMSHEIRTPMNGIVGLISLLERTELTETQRDYLSMMNRSGNLLLEIINDILEFSKIEAGMLELENEPFDLEKTIIDLVEVMSQQAYKKGIEINIFLDLDLPVKVIGDVTRLKQVLVNLVGNALKFTSSGYVKVSLVKVKNDDEFVDIRFSVQDTGIGIPASRLNSIFEAFTQADISDTRKYGGTGLGLTISKQIVQAFGGRLQVASEEGKGSTFFFELKLKYPKGEKCLHDFFKEDVVQHAFFISPNMAFHDCVKSVCLEKIKFSIYQDLVDLLEGKIIIGSEDFIFIDWLTVATMTDPEVNLFQNWVKSHNMKNIYILITLGEKSIVEKRLAEINCNFVLKPLKYRDLHKVMTGHGKADAKEEVLVIQKKKILLVDDAQVNQQVAKVILELDGHKVEIASNGQEAIDKFKTSEFDIILMDCQMPVLNGYDATIQIRNQGERGKTIPIVALTANALSETKNKCLHSGMNDFLTKPFQVDELRRVIQKNAG